MSVTVVRKNGSYIAAADNTRRVIVEFSRAGVDADTGTLTAELFQAALGVCMAEQVSRYCSKPGIRCDGLTIRLDCEVAGEPARVRRIRAQISLEGVELAPEQEAAVLSVARNALLPTSLRFCPSLEVVLGGSAT